jgi:endonuclease/exonuclease/phosphatase family metal-dependent hydrolase
VRLLTWNVARRVTRLAEQAAAISERRADVIALQEVTARTLPLWRNACEAIGLSNVLASFDWADPAREPIARRRTCVLIAARTPLRAVSRISAPWSETVAGAVVETELGPVEVNCAHVPNASNGWIKIETLESIRAGLAGLPPAPRILCGDLNTPRREHPDGTVLSFGRDHRGNLRAERGARWDEGELGVVPGLRDLGYSDAFRSLHGYERREPSWTWQQRAGHGGGWRLDHIFASAELRPVRCVYHHDWRDDTLSDHSALEADVELAG